MGTLELSTYEAERISVPWGNVGDMRRGVVPTLM